MDVGLLGGGVTFRIMEYQHHTKQIYGLHAFLHGVRSIGGLPSNIRHDSARVVGYVEAENEKAH